MKAKNSSKKTKPDVKLGVGQTPNYQNSKEQKERLKEMAKKPKEIIEGIIIVYDVEGDFEPNDTMQLIVKYDPMYHCILVSFGDMILFNGGSSEVYEKKYGEIQNDIVYDLMEIPGVAAIGGISNEMRFFLVKSETVDSVFPRILRTVIDGFGLYVTLKQMASQHGSKRMHVSLGDDVEYTPI